MSNKITWPIVLTLDAGGTNFVFTAIQEYEIISSTITYPSNAHNLDECLATIIKGFQEIRTEINESADAISFAFPGPADYHNGIIGDLPNFEAFSSAVPLAAILEDEFDIPVYINNDGNLFAYGESQFGYLPHINSKLVEAGNQKIYRNIIGITLGTGFGCGVVIDGNMLRGDNSSGAEIHNTSNMYNPEWNAEASISKRGLQLNYAERTNIENDHNISPFHLYQIAKGKKEGDQGAAIESFEAYGKALGNAIVNVTTLVDGIVVIGGGIRKAWDVISRSVFSEINRNYVIRDDQKRARLSFKVYDLQERHAMSEFLRPTMKKIPIPNSNREVFYEPQPRLGIALSKIGANTATAFGAYAFAAQKLKKKSM